MSPLPIRKNKDNPSMENKEIKDPICAQDFFSLFPFVQHLFGFEDADKEDKANIKEVWLNSSSLGGGSIEIGKNINATVIEKLKSKGLLSGLDGRFRLTDRGSKLLRDAILNDEQSSLTKKASKEMVSKSSYDFGDFVFVRVNNPEKFGAKYVNIKKSSFLKRKIKPTKIEEYKISTRKEDGSYKELSDYSDEELIHILHLSKKIINNSHRIIISGSSIKEVPVHKIKNFSIKILEELNKRI